MQGTLAALGVTLSDKITELRDLETAIGARKDELKDIHDIEVQADTLDEITAKVSEADEDAKERTRKRRKEWSDEQAERDQAWQREAEAHEYEVTQRQETGIPTKWNILPGAPALGHSSRGPVPKHGG